VEAPPIRRGNAVAATAGNFYVDSASRFAHQGNHEEEALGEASAEATGRRGGGTLIRRGNPPPAPPPADQDDDDAADQAAVTKTADQPAHQTSAPPPPTSSPPPPTSASDEAAVSSDVTLASEHGIVDAMFNYNATHMTENPMNNTAPSNVQMANGCSTMFIPQDRSTVHGCGGNKHCSCTSCKPGFAMVPLHHAQKTGICMGYSSHLALKCIRPNSRGQNNSPDDKDLLCTKALQVQTEFWYNNLKHQRLKKWFQRRLNKYPGVEKQTTDSKWTPTKMHIGIAVCNIHRQTVCMTTNHSSFCRAKKQVFCKSVCKMKRWAGEDRVYKNSCMPCPWFAGAVACRTAVMTS